MDFKDIIVHVDTDRACAARLELAIALARLCDAHLVGVFIKSRPDVPGYIGAQVGPEVMQRHFHQIEEAAEDAERMFCLHVKNQDISYEWRVEEGDPQEVLPVQARYADLLVIGQTDPEEPHEFGLNFCADQVIMEAGRPVLVVPYVGWRKTIGERVMVAWDASRLAARAVSDALPILERAKKVAVLAVNPQLSGERHGDIPGADVSLHLARHGIDAEAQHLSAMDEDPADIILSRAAEEGADLIVMGAYGHLRMRELILGGVTLHMLQHMTVPVLMSH